MGCNACGRNCGDTCHRPNAPTINIDKNHYDELKRKSDLFDTIKNLIKELNYGL